MHTPALLIDVDAVQSNIDATLRLLEGDANRWRPHLKTSKLGFVVRMLVRAGVRHAKCATALELETACEAGMADVLVAYQSVGPRAARVRAIAERFPAVRVSSLVEQPEACAFWEDSPVGVFADINSGMDRTGIAPDDVIARIIAIAAAARAHGVAFRGLHFYDGHISGVEPEDAERVAHEGYDRLLAIVARLAEDDVVPEEIVTSGTPAFPYALTYTPFRHAPFIHRVSPGTIVYGDATSLRQLSPDFGYRAAVSVASTVVSHPLPRRVTCDAGHKTVSADAGIPTCAVAGHPDYVPGKPSEEHLPIDLAEGADVPALGEVLYLVPRHVCPTVNNFDDAVIVKGGRAIGVERVTARGRHQPLTQADLAS